MKAPIIIAIIALVAADGIAYAVTENNPALIPIDRTTKVTTTDGPTDARILAQLTQMHLTEVKILEAITAIEAEQKANR